MDKSIPLGELMTEEEAVNLLAYVHRQRSQPSPKSKNAIIMKWLDDHRPVLEKAYKAGLIKAYFAYWLEYALTKEIP